MKRSVSNLIFLLLFSITPFYIAAAENHTPPDCFELAGKDARIDPDLLRAVAWHESRLNYRVTGNNAAAGFKPGYGYGLMQIDSQHLAFLSRFGITETELLNDICINIYAGAYIMAVAFNKLGANWNAVGAYNAGFYHSHRQQSRRNRYSASIYKTYRLLKALKARTSNQ